MTAAVILCPGPSLAATWPKHRPSVPVDTVIAVNRAIVHEPSVDWWVAGDWPVLKAVPGRPRRGICTQRDNIRMLESGGIIPLVKRGDWNPVYVGWNELPVGCRYSIIAALGLASYTGHSMVFIYGDDKRGRADWDGTPGSDDPKARGEERWHMEAALMEQAVEGLKARDASFFVQWVRP